MLCSSAFQYSGQEDATFAPSVLSPVELPAVVHNPLRQLPASGLEFLRCTAERLGDAFPVSPLKGHQGAHRKASQRTAGSKRAGCGGQGAAGGGRRMCDAANTGKAGIRTTARPSTTPEGTKYSESLAVLLAASTTSICPHIESPVARPTIDAASKSIESTRIGPAL